MNGGEFDPRQDVAVSHENLGARRIFARYRDDLWPSGSRQEAGEDGSGGIVIDADQGHFRVRNQPFLDRGVAVEIAVTVEMVGSHVEEQTDARRERRREIDLV